MSEKTQGKTLAQGGYESGCLLCGAPLIYQEESQEMECAVCHKKFYSNAACANGHFVCDRCHSGLNPNYLQLLKSSGEKDPLILLEQTMDLPGVHLLGPEHHIILPCVLLTAYKNCGGQLDYPVAIKEAFRRGKQIPGGVCGYMGTCGAAVGAGIYASLTLGSNPLKDIVWGKAQGLTARCLQRIAECGGVRCCKRTTRLAVEEAVAWTKETFNIEMPLSNTPCRFWEKIHECSYGDCPFFG